jgi:hypothetical protein
VLLAFSWLSMAYLVCFVLGLAYAVIAGIFSAVSGWDFGGDHDIDIGVDVDAGGEVDLGGGHDIVAGHDIDAGDVGGHDPGSIDGGPSVSPFSPPVVAITLLTFGGTGIIFTKVLGWEEMSLLPAAGSGIAIGLVTFLFYYTIIRKVQGSSSPSLQELIGIEAEATTPIPPDGVGEIAYVARGSRFTARARSTNGTTLASHSAVRIIKWVGHTAYVTPSD